MNNFVDTIKIELKKKTPEELSEKICELVTDNIIKDKEIERLNNIIDELEKDLEKNYIRWKKYAKTHKKDAWRMIICNYYLDKLKALKEGK